MYANNGWEQYAQQTTPIYNQCGQCIGYIPAQAANNNNNNDQFIKNAAIVCSVVVGGFALGMVIGSKLNDRSDCKHITTEIMDSL